MARHEVNKLFPGIHFEKLKGVQDPDGSSLWMRSILWVFKEFNRSVTANSGMLSPHGVFYGDSPPIPVLPFCKPAYHHVPRRRKIDPQARPCFFPNFGYNQGSDCLEAMDAETGMIVQRCNVTWHQPREPLISSAPIETPNYVHIQPPPVAFATPTAAPAPASAAATPMSASAPPLVAAPAHAPPLTPSAPIHDRAVLELEHEVDVRGPERTQGETCAIQDYSMDLISISDYSRLANQQVNREAINEAIREHGLPRTHIDLPTAPARALLALSTVANAEASERADIWRGSRAMEISGLLQVHTIGPA